MSNVRTISQIGALGFAWLVIGLAVQVIAWGDPAPDVATVVHVVAWPVFALWWVALVCFWLWALGMVLALIILCCDGLT